MRPLISWSALTSASVGIWGLGVEGTASLRRLQSMGIEPVLVDDHPALTGGSRSTAPEVLATGAGGLDALLTCDVVIKSPGISRYRPEVGELERAGVPVRSGLGLWLEDVPLEHVVCITGSKGKSTTSAIAGHLLTRLGYHAAVGGNIGRPPWDPTPGPAPDYWVIETSSYQIPGSDQRPAGRRRDLALPRPPGLARLRRALLRRQAVAVHQARCRAGDRRREQRDRCGSTPPRWGRTCEWVDADDPEFAGPWIDALGLPGVHNVRNAAIARAVLLAMGVAEAGDEARLTEAAAGFAGLPSRCRSLGHIGPVEFVDDSLSTNVLPAQAALEAYGGPAAWPCSSGATTAASTTRPWAGRSPTAGCPPSWSPCPTTGRASDSAVREVAGDRVEVVDADGLDEAVAVACDWAREGGVVLLSPAAPSFGRFADYQARARAFAEAVGNCGTLTENP